MRVMSPSDAEVTRAQRILDAMKQAAQEGKGAVSLDGRLIDYASIRQAEVMVGEGAPDHAIFRGKQIRLCALSCEAQGQPVFMCAVYRSKNSI